MGRRLDQSPMGQAHEREAAMNANTIVQKVIDGLFSGVGIIIAVVLCRKFLPGVI